MTALDPDRRSIGGAPDDGRPGLRAPLDARLTDRRHDRCLLQALRRSPQLYGCAARSGPPGHRADERARGRGSARQPHDRPQELTVAKTKPTTKKPPKGGVDPRQQQRTDIRSATASKYT